MNDYYLIFIGKTVITYYSEEINFYTFEEYNTAPRLILFNKEEAEKIVKDIKNSPTHYESAELAEIVPVGIKLMP